MAAAEQFADGELPDDAAVIAVALTPEAPRGG